MNRFCGIHKLKALMCGALILWVVFSASGQYPLQVQVNVSPPYPIRLSDFTSIESNVLVTIQNTSQDTYGIALVGTLRNEDTGASITSDINRLRGLCTTIPMGVTTLTGTDLRAMFNPDNMVFRGLSRETIRGDEALPEGRYSLCIRVMDCNVVGKYLSDLPMEPIGCASFDVSYVDPPVIISTECDQIISHEATQMNIVWTQVMPTRPGAIIDYSIRMVEIEPPTRNPFDAMMSSPPVFTKEVSGMTVYNLMIPEDVILERGRKYAIQVTASNPDGDIAFRNQGRSEICTFVFGTPLPSAGGFAVTASYPLAGDVLPFSYFPIIVQFTPYDDAYTRFGYQFNISGTNGYSDFKNDQLRWPRGPLAGQRAATGFGDLTREQSQYIALNKNQTETTVSFERGNTYTWNASIEMDRGSSTLPANIPATTFGVGMAPSVLKLPPDADTVPPGEIKFKWMTASPPVKLLPDFAIVQARGTGPSFFNGIVDERWVIEISREESFATIVETISGRLGYSVDLNASPQAIKDELYKDLEEHFTITENGKYYWRVRWMKAPDNPGDNTSYATSPTWSFFISDSAPSTPVATRETEEDPGACISTCLAEPVTDRTAVASLSAGAEVQIGKFTLTVRNVTSSGGSRFTGEGVVRVPFLNNINILVDFTNIQVNAANKVFAGTVKAKADREFVTEDIHTRAGEVLGMSESEARALSGFLSDGERLVSAFTGSREIGMPIGIDREIDGHRYVIGIVNFEFSPERAIADALMSLDFPEIGDRILALGVKDLCITPGGLGDEGRLYLARDWVVVQEGETQFAFKGAESADTTRATYVSWDCRGFKCLQVRGEVTFPRSMLVPDNADGTIGEGNVKGLFGVKACRGNNWIATITFDPFQVNGLAGWGWNTSNAYIDLSDIENPPGFRLPRGYGDTTLTDPRLVSTWKGFYMERIEVKLPPEFASDVTPDGRTSFGAFETIIDGTGLTTSIRALNVLEVSEGNFEGWGFAIDTINFDMVSNTFTEAGMAGRLGMPIFEEGDHLKYSMALSFDDGSDEFSYQFRVFTRDTLNIPMWGAAQMFFKPNSSVEIGLNDRVKGDHITAILHGGVHLVGDFGAISDVAFKGVNFEGLYISTFADPEGRYFKADSFYVAHASPQKSASGFPVNISNINLNINTPTRPGIEFDLQLLFSEGSTSIGADATFGVFATFNKIGDRFEVGFGGVDVGRIGIDVSVSVMKLRGELEFYKDDPTYGNGTRGNIRVELPMDISGELTAYFGTVGGPSRGRFGTRDYYAYWLVDGMITFPGLPIFSGFAIYGFGGGAYHHMTMASDLPDPQNTQSGSGRTSIRYVPNFDTSLGLKFAAVFGTHPSSEAFNMDVRLQAEFNSSFGLNFISVGGDGYFMASLTERGDAKVWANVNLMFDNRPAEGPKFTGNFDVFVRVGEYLYGAQAGNKFVGMEFYVDKDTWYMYMGTPENRSGLIADVRVIQARLTSYLMIGHGIPVALPPLPPRIMAVLGGSGGRLEGESETVTKATSRARTASDDAAYRSGQGFAFGTALALDVNLDFAIFYASLGLDLGFDLNFSKPAPGSVFCAETGQPPRGIDGWYIQGQVFAGIYGEMGVQVDLFFIKGKYPFIQLGAAAMLQGNFPDPSGFRGRAGLYYSILGGMVEGRCNFNMEIGQKCTFVIPNPLSGMNMIAEVMPENGSREQSCFTSPAVSFNVPVEKFLEFPMEAADGTEVTRTFFPFVETFVVKKQGSSQTVNGAYSLQSNNTVLKFRLDEMLEGNADYEVRIVVKAREHFSNGTQQIVRNGDGSVWSEERVVAFRTGPVPDFIPLDQIVYTYPVEGQFYHLKGEGVSSKSIRETRTTRSGVIQLENPVDRIFSREIEGRRYKYLVRYVPVAGGEKTEHELTYSTGRVMSLPLPEMDNETMYGVQIVRKLIPAPVSTEERLRREVQHQASARFNVAASRVALSSSLAGGSTVNIRSQAERLLPGEVVEPGEKLLYKFYFRTSKFNTLQEKLASAGLNAAYVNAFIAEGFSVKTTVAEPFDRFEAFGLYKNGAMVMKPLLSIIDPWVNDYHVRVVQPAIYDLHASLTTLISSVPGITRFRLAQLNRHGKGIPPMQTVTVSDRSRLTAPIQSWQVEREARNNPQYNQGGISPAFAAAASNMSGFQAATQVLGGSSTRFVPQAAIGTMTASVPNLELSVVTSSYVWTDFLDLQRTVGQAMAWTPTPIFPSGYPIRDAVNRNRVLAPKVNLLLRNRMIDYRYTRGTYQIQIQYQWPRGNNAYGTGTKATKTFTY